MTGRACEAGPAAPLGRPIPCRHGNQQHTTLGLKLLHLGLEIALVLLQLRQLHIGKGHVRRGVRRARPHRVRGCLPCLDCPRRRTLVSMSDLPASACSALRMPNATLLSYSVCGRVARGSGVSVSRGWEKK